MKIFSLFLFLGVSAFADPNSCIKGVSNYELAQEVMVRLTSGSSTPATTGKVTYICDRQYLYFYVTNNVGKEIKEFVNTSSNQSCTEQAEELTQYKNKIHDLTIAAICDRHYLYILKMTGVPSLSKDWIATTSESDCRKQMTVLNKSN